MKESLSEILASTADPQSKAKFILTMPKSSVLKTENLLELQNLLETDDQILVKFVAAQALAHAKPEISTSSVIDVFLEVLNDAKPIVNSYKLVAIGSTML